MLKPPLHDIAVNLCDEMFRGIYHGRQKHLPDFERVLKRAQNAGLRYLLLVSTSDSDFQWNLDFIEKYNQTKDQSFDIGVTAGIHPTQSNILATNDGVASEKSTQVLDKLVNQISGNSWVHAIGEFGLDYDRTHFASKMAQKRAFQDQLDRFLGLAMRLGKPLFLHGRGEGAIPDMIEMMESTMKTISISSSITSITPITPINHSSSSSLNAVLHSFDGSKDDAKLCLDLGFYIGLNGCSLKTRHNLDVVAQLPINRILVETDSPWCSIKASHASWQLLEEKGFSPKERGFPGVKAASATSIIQSESPQQEYVIKDRCEPIDVISVIRVLAILHDKPEEFIIDQLDLNLKNFFKHQ